MTIDPILGAFERLAERAGTAPLVASPGRMVTRAAEMASRGAREGSYVLLSSVNGTGFLAALLAVRRSRGVPVLVDCTSPRAESERIVAALDIELSIRCDDPFPRDLSSFVVESH